MKSETPTETTPINQELSAPPPPKHTKSALIALCILIVLLGILALFFEKITNISWLQDVAYTALGKKNPNVLPQPTATPIPTPTPSYLPAGKQTYSISGSSIGPKISSLTMDPLDAHNGDTQSLSVNASSDEPLVSISITVFSDTKKTTLPLSFDGKVWHTSWVLHDSVNSRYIIRIDATDEATSSSTLIAPRTNGPIHLDQLK